MTNGDCIRNMSNEVTGPELLESTKRLLLYVNESIINCRRVRDREWHNLDELFEGYCKEHPDEKNRDQAVSRSSAKYAGRQRNTQQRKVPDRFSGRESVMKARGEA